MVSALSVPFADLPFADRLRALADRLERSGDAFSPEELAGLLRELSVEAAAQSTSLAAATAGLDLVRRAVKVDRFGMLYDVHFGDLAAALGLSTDG